MPEVLTPAQEAVLADKLQKQAGRAAAKTKTTAPTGDEVYTAPPTVAPLAVARAGVAFLCEPFGLAPADGLTPATEKADDGYRQKVDAWKASRTELNTMRDVADAETVTAADIRKVRDDAISTELQLAQQAVALCREFVARQQARLPELRDFAAKQAEKLIEVEANVTKQLNDAGVSVQSQRAWPDAPESAEISFSHTVKQAAAWQEQRLQVSQADSTVQSAADQITAGKLRIDEAVKSLSQKVAKLVA